MRTETLRKKTPTLPPALIKTTRVVGGLRKIKDGWAGTGSLKPAKKALAWAKKILAALEKGCMPWPVVVATKNGGVVIIWESITRDIMVTISPDGLTFFNTILKHINEFGDEDKIESNGSITTVDAIDHMMAWFAADIASHA